MHCDGLQKRLAVVLHKVLEIASPSERVVGHDSEREIKPLDLLGLLGCDDMGARELRHGVCLRLCRGDKGSLPDEWTVSSAQRAESLCRDTAAPGVGCRLQRCNANNMYMCMHMF